MMRKQIIQQEPPAQHNGLNLEQLAQVEISSEDELHPIESAFSANGGTGWKAAQPGEQTIRLLFDEPQEIRQILVVFRETEQERTQEFLLRWLPSGEESYREIARQQYNFSPPHTTEESENYTVELHAAKALELTIKPNISGGNAYASLAQLQLK